MLCSLTCARRHVTYGFRLELSAQCHKYVYLFIWLNFNW
jgi:hypothetical protein